MAKFIQFLIFLSVFFILSANLSADEAMDLGEDYTYHDLNYENIHDVLPDVWMQHAKELYNRGQFQNAADIFKKVLLADPSYVEAHRYLEKILAKDNSVGLPTAHTQPKPDLIKSPIQKVKLPSPAPMEINENFQEESDFDGQSFDDNFYNEENVADKTHFLFNEPYQYTPIEIKSIDENNTMEQVPLELNDQEIETIEKKIPQMDQGKKKDQIPLIDEFQGITQSESSPHEFNQLLVNEYSKLTFDIQQKMLELENSLENEHLAASECKKKLSLSEDFLNLKDFQVSVLSDKLKNYRQAIARLKNEATFAKGQSQSCKNELIDTQDELENKNNKNLNLQSLLQIRNHEFRDIQQDLAISQEHNFQLEQFNQSECKTLNSDAMNKIRYEMQSVRLQNQKFVDDLNSKETRLKELEESLIHKDIIYNEQQKELVVLQDQLNKINKLANQEEYLRSQRLNESERLTNKLIQSQDDLKTIAEDVLQRNKIIKDLDGRLKITEERMRAQERILSQDQEAIAALKKEIQVYSRQREKFESKLKEKEEILMALENKISDSQLKERKAQEEISKVRRELEQSYVMVLENDLQVRELRKQVLEKESRILNLENRL